MKRKKQKMSLRTYTAEIGEIARAAARDDEEIADIETRLSKIAQEVLTQRSWLRSLPHLATLSKTLYYSATLMSGVQTLGEEYVHLLETAFPGLAQGYDPPTWLRRLLFLFLHVYAPLIVDRTLANAERRLEHRSTRFFLGVDISRNTVARKSFLNIVQWLRISGVLRLQRLHLAIFYLFGVYYHLSRRVAGIRFLSLSPASDIKALRVYRLLGWVTLAETALAAAYWAVAALKNEKVKETELEESEEETDVIEGGGIGGVLASSTLSYPSCSLCSTRRPPACPPCGHVHCWHCLQQLAAASSRAGEPQPRCPLCRTHFNRTQLVPLLNL